MDWYSVSVAAVCGGIAGGIGALAASRLQKKSARQMVTTAITVILSLTLYQWADGTIIAEHKEQRALAEFESTIIGNPAYDAVQEYAPETMTEIRDYLRTAVREGHDARLVESNTRQILAGVVTNRLPKASDAAILNSIQLSVDQMKWLHARGDDSCFKLLFPAVDGGIQALDVFPEELMARDFESTRLILSTYDDTREVPSQEQAMEVLNPIFVDLVQAYGQEAVATMADVTAAGTDRSQVCSMSIDLYTSLLARGDTDAALALRWMLQ